MKKIGYFIHRFRWHFLLVLALLISSYFKFTQVSGYSFPFTMDQGRDMADIRHMVVTYTPRLVGPTTSINGVLLGPFWYYFNLIPFLAGGGDPAFVVYWQIIWYAISAIVLWLVLKKKSLSLATIVSVLYLLMPVGFNTARYFWNANAMVFFVAFFFASLIQTLENPSTKNLVILSIISGIGFQIEAAFGVLLFPFAGLCLLFKRLSVKKLFIPIIGFGLTLIPQILFELRHGFVMTKIFIKEFTGKGEMLGEKITFSDRLDQRWQYFVDMVRQSNHLPENILFFLFLVALLIFAIYLFKSKNKPIQNTWLLSFGFILFSAIFYVLFPQKLKTWYVLGISVPLIIFLASFTNFILEKKNLYLKILALTLIASTFVFTIKAQVQYINDISSKPSNDRSSLNNELKAIDWVYTNAEGKGFKVYSYLPSVYDFPYHHLFWWYGTKTYKYQPFDTAYLPNQPEYIKNNDLLWKHKKPVENELTFLIIEDDSEMPTRTQEWLGNFSKLCLIKEEILPWHTKVKMMSQCPK